jgi:hypothetical protein
MSDFHGLPTAALENEHLRLEYLTTAGPRIIGLSYHGSPNLMAEVPDIAWDTPNGKYTPLGGHRLWNSPEVPETTYFPDGSGLQVETREGRVELSLVGPEIYKKLQIELELELPALRLVHTLANTTTRYLQLAPWAITMFPLGGSVILPQPSGNADPHGLLPNRLLALWPYTRINDARLVRRNDFILLQATASLPPVKLGYLSTAGWLAYWRDGILFRKSFDLHPRATYPDFGCNAESYCGDRFVELESLGPLVTLAPGGETQLTETWEVYPGLDVPFIPPEIRNLINR